MFSNQIFCGALKVVVMTYQSKSDVFWARSESTGLCCLLRRAERAVVAVRGGA